MQSGAVVLFFLVGYFGVGWLATDRADARSLATPLDAAIPFLLGSVVVYWSILPMGLLPVFVVAERDVFRRVALAYSVTIAVALAIFVAFPVTSAGFRPDAAAFADSGFAGWLLRLLHFLDPPLNLFPSLHLALAFLAALAAVRVRSPLGAVAVLWTLCIAVSVCTTKQHFAVDAVAGLALAALVHRLVVARSCVPAARADATFGARGIALFAGLVALFYAGLYGAYLVGFEPWSISIG
ncbi:MAG: phosphatase PAP2 family protein [Myxococcota bacterium]